MALLKKGRVHKLILQNAEALLKVYVLFGLFGSTMGLKNEK